MATPLQLQNTAKTINITDIIDKIVAENEAQILKIYHENQLSKGKDENNNDIASYTSSWYEHYIKPSVRPDWTGVFDLHLTGKLYSEQKIINHKSGNFYQIAATTVPYFNDLVTRYGVKWMGLSLETLTIVINTILWPQFIREIKEKMKL